MTKAKPVHEWDLIKRKPRPIRRGNVEQIGGKLMRVWDIRGGVIVAVRDRVTRTPAPLE